MATELNLHFTRGDTYTIDADVFESDGITPLNLTNAVVTMTCKADRLCSDSDALFQISTVTGDIAITNPGTLGQFVVSIPGTATISLSPLQLRSVFDIVIEIAPAYRETVFHGHLELTENVTDL